GVHEDSARSLRSPLRGDLLGSENALGRDHCVCLGWRDGMLIPREVTMRFKKLVLASFLVTAIAATSCAKAHHIATVTVLSAHQTIALVQDTADAVTCGSPTAPDPC